MLQHDAARLNWSMDQAANSLMPALRAARLDLSSPETCIGFFASITRRYSATGSHFRGLTVTGIEIIGTYSCTQIKAAPPSSASSKDEYEATEADQLLPTFPAASITQPARASQDGQPARLDRPKSSGDGF